MCERLTSHLFDLKNRKMLVHTIYSHSRTRDALGLTDKDANVVEVEWLEQAAEPYIRWDGSRADEAERHAVYDWYARRFPTRESLVMECLRQGVIIVIRATSELDGVGELPNCTSLDCCGCTGLTELPELKECTALSCRGCTGLTKLPNLEKCTNLYCAGCTGLTKLPALEKCTHLNCSGCTGLTKLPNLEKCIYLVCTDCVGLTKLPELKGCTNLGCCGCTGLTELPELKECTALSCRGCTGLTKLPNLEKCIYLCCDDRLKPHPNKETPHD
jgi:hypothetical protein